MAKQQFLDRKGLEELVKHIPQIIPGDNITITPDIDKTNKIIISSNGTDIDFATITDINAIFA